MRSIVSNAFAFVARNALLVLGFAAVTSVPALFPSLSGSASIGALLILFATLADGTLRHALLNEPLSQALTGKGRSSLKMMGALALVFAPPLILGAIMAVTMVSGDRDAASLGTLGLMVLLGPVWLGLTGLALPAAALRRPVLAATFVHTRRTALPIMGGVFLICLAVFVLSMGLGIGIALLAPGVLETTAGSFGLSYLVNLAQEFAFILIMFLLAHVWQTRVELPTQAEVFA